MRKTTVRKTRSRPRYNGKLVTDATAPYTFKVTPAHCQRAIPGDQGRCAAALAVLADKRVEYANVGRNFAIIDFNDLTEAQRYELDGPTKALVEANDITGLRAHPGLYGFLPPRGVRTLEHLRATASSRRVRKGTGTPHKTHRLPDSESIAGVRRGLGRYPKASVSA